MEVRTDVQASAFLKNGWSIEDRSIKEESVPEQTYSKTIIARMPIAELRALAEKEEISGFDEKTGAELKKLLIKKYGL